MQRSITMSGSQHEGTCLACFSRTETTIHLVCGFHPTHLLRLHNHTFVYQQISKTPGLVSSNRIYDGISSRSTKKNNTPSYILPFTTEWKSWRGNFGSSHTSKYICDSSPLPQRSASQAKSRCVTQYSVYFMHRYWIYDLVLKMTSVYCRPSSTNRWHRVSTITDLVRIPRYIPRGWQPSNNLHSKFIRLILVNVGSLRWSRSDYVSIQRMCIHDIRIAVFRRVYRSRCLGWAYCGWPGCPLN